MNLGAPEVLIIFVLFVVAFVMLGLTLWGLIDALKRNQTGWLIGIIAGWVVGLGWAVAILYLVAARPDLVRAEAYPPYDPPPGGFGDPPPAPPFSPPGS